LHPKSQEGVVELVRIINSYYSNLIEGNSTHPLEIERAMRADYSQDPARRNLQLESLAHICCQRAVEELMANMPVAFDSTTDGFLSWVHHEFYKLIPDEMRWVANEKTGEKVEVIGGQFRERDVEVGRHLPPEHTSLSMFMARFHDAYKTKTLHGLEPVIAAAASHHRLVWIHPFLDGNGRVARLFTDTYLRSIPMPGYGLWNVSRGLARGKDKYMEALAVADARRRNDLDGRGNLSNEGLTFFCKFFLLTCLDQVEYMTSMLSLDDLLGRILGYVKLRELKMASAPLPDQYPTLKVETAQILQEVLLRGEMTRGDAAAACPSPRMGRDILAQLLAEGLLVSSSSKGPVRMGFPAHAAGRFFPDLFPMGA
jgi:Fic family protein